MKLVLSLILATSLVDAACSSLYGQCGGIGWKGPTCCDASSCSVQNPYYSQCVPGSAPPPPPPPPPPPKTSSTPPKTTTPVAQSSAKPSTTPVKTTAPAPATTVPPSTGPIPNQSGNPTADWFRKARTKWAASLADKILTYQYSNGGFGKNIDYAAVGNGKPGSPSGQTTFDNGATSTEAVYFAEVYKNTKNIKYRDAARKAVSFILSAQYQNGGWPQFFPLKGGYPDHVTYNDDAMVHLLTLLDSAVKKISPLDTDIFTDADRSKFKSAVDRGVDYILKSQWKQNGKLTVWCAQHGVTDYLPKPARVYELESLSGSESIQIIGFLLTQPQTPQIQAAVKGALAWYRSPNTYLDGYEYISGDNTRIVPKAGSKMWYRFYKLDTNRGFFSDRDGGTYYDITQISAERRNGYRWGGDYGTAISAYGASVGY